MIKSLKLCSFLINFLHKHWDKFTMDQHSKKTQQVAQKYFVTQDEWILLSCVAFQSFVPFFRHKHRGVISQQENEEKNWLRWCTQHRREQQSESGERWVDAEERNTTPQIHHHLFPPLGFDSSRWQRLMIPSKTRSAGNPQHYTHSEWRSNTHTPLHPQAPTHSNTHTNRRANISTQKHTMNLWHKHKPRQQTCGENIQMKTHTHTLTEKTCQNLRYIKITECNEL